MNLTNRPRTPAYDCVGTLDILVCAILHTLGLEREALRDDNLFGSLADITERNARRLVDYFGGRNISAIKHIRDASGMSLVDSKAAWEQILETYELDKTFLRSAILKSLDAGDTDSARYYLGKFEALR